MSAIDRPSAASTSALEGRAEPDDVYDAICDRGNLTRRQLLIWAGGRLAPGVPVFTEGGLLHIRGRVDPGMFQRAFRAVLEQCDALRMIVEDVDGWPQQRLRSRVESTLDLVDLSSAPMPPVALEDLARERLSATVGGTGPVLDAVLVRLQPEHYVWVLVQHQLISDAWSFRLVHQRMVDHYQREQRGYGAADVVPQFQEYLSYERNYRASPQYRTARAYWRNRVPNAPVRPAAVHFGSACDATKVRRVSHRLGQATTAALRRLAATGGASADMGLFTVVAALMSAHLYRTTGTQDVMLSVPFANRPSQRFKRTVGSFMNVCPLRVGVERGDTFLTLLRRVEHEAWEAARHQGCVVPQVAGVQPYDLLVNVHKEAVAARAFGDLPMDVEWLAPTHRIGALSVGVQDFNAAGNLILTLDFNEATFGSATREDMSRSLLRLLDGCVAEPTRRLDHEGVVSAAAGIREEAAEGRRGGAATAEPRAAAPPQTDVERVVAAIWCDLLGKSAVGRDDDFFELGGDSLLAYRMLVRVGAALLVEPSAAGFFECPTVAGVAAAVETAHAGGLANGEIEDALREIEALSDAEAAARFGAGTSGAGPHDG